MSAPAFISLVVCLSGLLVLAALSGPLASATASFFYGNRNRRIRK
jgi:hypothetical protein